MSYSFWQRFFYESAVEAQLDGIKHQEGDRFRREERKPHPAEPLPRRKDPQRQVSQHDVKHQGDQRRVEGLLDRLEIVYEDCAGAGEGQREETEHHGRHADGGYPRVGRDENPDDLSREEQNDALDRQRKERRRGHRDAVDRLHPAVPARAVADRDDRLGRLRHAVEDALARIADVGDDRKDGDRRLAAYPDEHDVEQEDDKARRRLQHPRARAVFDHPPPETEEKNGG